MGEPTAPQALIPASIYIRARAGAISCLLQQAFEAGVLCQRLTGHSAPDFSRLIQGDYRTWITSSLGEWSACGMATHCLPGRLQRTGVEEKGKEGGEMWASG